MKTTISPRVSLQLRNVSGPTYTNWVDGGIPVTDFSKYRQGVTVAVTLDGRQIAGRTVWRASKYGINLPVFPWRLARTKAHMKEVASDVAAVVARVDATPENHTRVWAPAVKNGIVVEDYSMSPSYTVPAGRRFAQRIARACSDVQKVHGIVQGIE